MRPEVKDFYQNLDTAWTRPLPHPYDILNQQYPTPRNAFNSSSPPFPLPWTHSPSPLDPQPPPSLSNNSGLDGVAVREPPPPPPLCFGGSDTFSAACPLLPVWFGSLVPYLPPSWVARVGKGKGEASAVEDRFGLVSCVLFGCAQWPCDMVLCGGCCGQPGQQPGGDTFKS